MSTFTDFDVEEAALACVDHHTLDVVISVGYRVKSLRGTQFSWATNTVRKHLLRGCTLTERSLRERGLGEIEQTSGGEPLYSSALEDGG